MPFLTYPRSFRLASGGPGLDAGNAVIANATAAAAAAAATDATMPALFAQGVLTVLDHGSESIPPPPHASHPDFLHLTLLVFEAVLEVVFVSLPGYIVARQGMFDAESQKFVANLNVMVFTPCLIFTKLASQLTAEKLADLAVIPFIFVAQTVVSWLCAWIISLIFRFKKRPRNFVTAMAVFGNSNSLPISLVLSLSKTISGLHWDNIPGDNDDEVAARGILYLLIFQQLGQLVRWTWGYNILLKPREAYIEEEEDEERQGILDAEAQDHKGGEGGRKASSTATNDEEDDDGEEGSASGSGGTASGSQTEVDFSQSVTSTAEAGERTPLNPKSSPNSVSSKPPSLKGKASYIRHAGPQNDSTAMIEPEELSRSSRTNTDKTIRGSSMTTEESEEGGVIRSTRDEIVSFPGPPPTGSSPTSRRGGGGGGAGGPTNSWRMRLQRTTSVMSQRSAKVTGRAHAMWMRVFRMLPTPVQRVLGTGWGYAVRFWRGLCEFMNPPLWAMLVAILVASIPDLQFLFFTRGTFINNSITRAVDQSGGVAVPLILVVLGANLARNTLPGKDPDELEDPRMERKLLIAALLSRMLLPILLMAPLLAVMAKFVPVSILDDPIFVIVCFLLTGAPSALQLAQICQINNVYMGAMSRLLFQSYVVWILPSTLVLVTSALEVVEWAKQ